MLKKAYANHFLFLFLFINTFSNIHANVVSMSGKLPPANNQDVSYREVSLQLRIMHIYDINLDHQTVRLSGYFRQSWNDSRMMGNQSDGVTPDGRRFFLMNKAQALWYPDTFISNSIDHQDRQSFAGDPHGAYHYFRVYTDGEVLYSQMIDIMIKTKMNLRYFPFNILNISLDVESYGYPDHTLRYAPGSSSDTDGLIIKITNVPGYEINESLAKSYLTTAGYSTGNFSKIEMSFNLIPNESSIFILSIPNLLLIIISSFVFWMDIKKKLSERLSLGITAMLADFALSFSLPVPDTPDFMYVREYINISYIFIGFSIFFTFTEYVIVSFVYNVKSGEDFTTSEKDVLSYLEKPKDKKLTPRKNKNTLSNLKTSFTKLINMNELLRMSLMEYMNNTLPEEPVIPIKASLGVFYLSCWVTFMLGHIIPGRIIVDKAKEGIDYHQQATQYFPTILGVGLGVSFILSIIAYIVQNRSRKKWIEKLETREYNISKNPAIVDTKVLSGSQITSELENKTISTLATEIKKATKPEFTMNELDLKLENLSKEIDNDFKALDECMKSVKTPIITTVDNNNENIQTNACDESNEQELQQAILLEKEKDTLPENEEQISLGNETQNDNVDKRNIKLNIVIPSQVDKNKDNNSSNKDNDLSNNDEQNIKLDVEPTPKKGIPEESPTNSDSNQQKDKEIV